MLDDLERLLGPSDFSNFMDALAGQRVYFPRPAGLKQTSTLVKVLGFEKAQSLCAFFATSEGGFHLNIPLDDYSSHVDGLMNRRASGMQMIMEGATANEVCAKLKVCERTVFRWRKKLRQRGKI